MADFTNTMYGRGTVVGGGDLKLNIDTTIAKPDKTILNCKTNIFRLFRNSFECSARILKFELPKVTLYPDNDTYVQDHIPFFSYYDKASLVQGVYDDIEYRSYMTFNGLNTVVPKVKKFVNRVIIRMINTNQLYRPANIKLYDLKETFSETNISWLHQPELNEYITTSNYDYENGVYEFDITDFVKEKYEKNELITGFGFDTDILFLTGSYNSIYSPYLIIEYAPDDLFGDLIELPIKTNAQNIGKTILNCKTNFNDEYPRIDVRTIFSKESIKVSSKILFVSKINCKTRYTYPPETKVLDCKTIYSQDRINIRIPLGVNIYLPVKTKLLSHENIELPIKTDIIPIDVIKLRAKTLFGDKIELPIKTSVDPGSLIELNCKTIFSRDRININTIFLDSETTELPIKTSLLTSAVSMFRNCKTIFSKDFINCKTDINLSIGLNCKTKIQLYKLLNIKTQANVYDFTKLPCKVTIGDISSINVKTIYSSSEEMSLPVKTQLIKNDMIVLNGKTRIKFDGIKLLPIKTDILFVEKLPIKVRVKFANKELLNCKTAIIVLDMTKLDSKTILQFTDKTKLNVKTVYCVSDQTSIDCKTKIIKPNNMSILGVRIPFVVIAKTGILTKTNYLKGGISMLDVKTNAITDEELNIELNCKTQVIVQDKISINIGTEIDKPGSLPLKIRSRLLKTEKTELDVNTNLQFKDETKLDINTNLQFNAEERIDVKTIFIKNEMTYLVVKTASGNIGEMELPVKTLFLDKKEISIDIKVPLKLNGQISFDVKTIYVEPSGNNLIVIIEE